MVKFHGSQCGFSASFVMSLFAMYKNFKKFDNEIIEETLSEIYVDALDIDQSLMLQKLK